MADISKITLPSGSTYDIKDAVAREKIASLSGAMTYLGETTTALTDGCTTSPITINNNSVTPKPGNVVIYGDCEFVWSDETASWNEFGSTGSLKALAFKDQASTNYTPSGSVAAPTVNVSVNTATIIPFGSPGQLPSCTLPTMSATVSGEILSLSWTAGSFSAGSLPSAGSSVTVATGIKSATATAPKFTGSAATITVK